MTSKEWEYFKLSEITNLITRGITPKYVDQNGLVVINQKCIRNGNISFADARFTDNISKKVPDNKLIRQNDILICSTGIGTLGRVGFFRNAIKTKATVDSHVTIVRANEEYVDYKYLGYNLFNRQQEIEALAQGSTGQTELSRVDLGELVILLPPIEIQQKIAKVLSSLDDKIELNNKINQNLEQQAQAIFKSWFVDFEPFGGKMPEDWRIGKLGDLAQITSGKRPQIKQSNKDNDFKIPIIGASDIMGYTNTFLYNEPILITGRVGTHGIVNKYNKQCWPSDNTLVIKSEYYEYVYQQLKSINYAGLNRGSTQPLITQKDLLDAIIVIPAIQKLKEYEQFSTQLNKLQDNLLVENKNLSSIRDLLLPKLLNNELNIDNIEV